MYMYSSGGNISFFFFITVLPAAAGERIWQVLKLFKNLAHFFVINGDLTKVQIDSKK